jgi:myo-inositol 2-dehydrogenase/D-chiro-inositol 1-dehydrogenase
MTPTRNILNVGIVGLGRMGNRHASNFLRLVPRARLLCVCTPAQHELKWAEEHLVPHGVQVYASFEEMLAVKDLEAVVIASSTALHVPQTLAALERGLHVLCEKPISTSVAEVSGDSVIYFVCDGDR